jgi:hypothetical protein
MTLILPEGLLVQVKNCIVLICIFKHPRHREDAIGKNSREGLRRTIFSERCDVLYAGG